MDLVSKGTPDKRNRKLCRLRGVQGCFCNLLQHREMHAFYNVEPYHTQRSWCFNCRQSFHIAYLPKSVARLQASASELFPRCLCDWSLIASPTTWRRLLDIFWKIPSFYQKWHKPNGVTHWLEQELFLRDKTWLILVRKRDNLQKLLAHKGSERLWAYAQFFPSLDARPFSDSRVDACRCMLSFGKMSQRFVFISFTDISTCSGREWCLIH